MRTTMQIQQAEQAVKQLASQWRGAPPITVVADARSIPGVKFENARGAFCPAHNDVFIVANTQPLSKVADSVAHEVLGHLAMRQHLGRHWLGYMGAIQGGVRNGDWWLGEFRHDVRRAYVDDQGQAYLTPIQEADELVAAVTETFFRPEIGRIKVKTPIRARLAAASGHFQREILLCDTPVCMQQLLGTILAAEHRLRHGGQFFGLGYRIKRWYARAMPKFDPHARPMSLAESQALLASEAERLVAKEDRKGSALAVLLFLSIIGFIFCVGYLVFWVLSLFGPLFK